MRHLKPSEYPLAQPYRLKIVTATQTTKIEDYVKNMPDEKFKKEQLELLNGLYPKGEPKRGVAKGGRVAAKRCVRRA